MLVIHRDSVQSASTRLQIETRLLTMVLGVNNSPVERGQGDFVIESTSLNTRAMAQNAKHTVQGEKAARDDLLMLWEEIIYRIPADLGQGSGQHYSPWFR